MQRSRKIKEQQGDEYKANHCKSQSNLP
jgi:hypothetical protein